LIESDKMTALINWLVAGAPPKRSFDDLVTEIGQRLTGTGLPVHQLGLYQVLIHPEAPGRFNYWTQKGGGQRGDFVTGGYQTAVGGGLARRFAVPGLAASWGYSL
jgi:hypothetical protein